MKHNVSKLAGGMAFLAGLIVSTAAYAATSDQVTKTLAGSSVLERPAIAADLVAKASAADQQALAVTVVKAAVRLNPAAVVAIVSAVARENPSAAPIVTVTAVTLQHKLIDVIVKAASAAAPSETARIVAAVIKEFPKDYGIVAVAAAEGVPGAGRQILDVVADYVPALQTAIQGTTANFAANQGNVPVQAILSQSYKQTLLSGPVVSAAIPSSLAQTSARFGSSPSMTSASPLLSPPSFGPPYTPIFGPVTTYTPSQVIQEQPGGRNYSPP